MQSQQGSLEIQGFVAGKMYLVQLVVLTRQQYIPRRGECLEIELSGEYSFDTEKALASVSGTMYTQGNAAP